MKDPWWGLYCITLLADGSHLHYRVRHDPTFTTAGLKPKSTKMEPKITKNRLLNAFGHPKEGQETTLGTQKAPKGAQGAPRADKWASYRSGRESPRWTPCVNLQYETHVGRIALWAPGDRGNSTFGPGGFHTTKEGGTPPRDPNSPKSIHSNS